MRWSSAFIPTLRNAPADAEAESHRLLVRAGFIRRLMAGSYSLLPLGMRVAEKISDIVREEMDRIGAQEFLLPALHPREVWQRSGRWDAVGKELFRLQDRSEADLCLGMTHEEVFALIAAELSSYRDLPQIWYQIQTKFRDEPRPKSGLLRVREFTMKDSYSLDLDEAGLDVAFDKHHEAYRRIFRRLGFDAIPVEASSGVMGGTTSIEFMVRSEAGEDLIATCEECGYAANVHRATSALESIEDEPGPEHPERFATPGVRTIEDLVRFPGGAPAHRQIKTLVYVLGGDITLVLLRGDHGLLEQKLIDGTQTPDVRPAHPDEVRRALGASVGSVGAVDVTDHRVIADLALRGRTNMVTGANEDEFHVRGVDVERDIGVDDWLDLREVRAGERCPKCSAPLRVDKAIEVGHIFKLGTKYSEALGATVLDEHGDERPIVMGSYGIGIGRNAAAIVEAHRDERGIVWPVAVAPFEAVVVVINAPDAGISAAGERLYTELRAAGVDALLDDRDERPGVKFTDTELIGIPYRLTVGPKDLADGIVEITWRKGLLTERVRLEEAAQRVAVAVSRERSLGLEES
ncbi:MAG: proline--tRNA ligase [Acidimicrobiia bacterium]